MEQQFENQISGGGVSKTVKSSVSSSSKLLNLEYPYKTSWDKNKNSVEFEIRGCNVSLINSIRRSIISAVPTVGFRSEPYEKSTIEIIINDSPLHNQFIAHRISMVPLYIANVEAFDPNNFEFILDVSNNTNFNMDITTEHFKIKDIRKNTFLSQSETRKIFPPNPITNDYILITRLKPRYYQFGKVINQDILRNYKDTVADDMSEHSKISSEQEVKIYVKARAVIGTGAENGHFNPTSCSCYSYKMDPEKVKLAEREFIDNETQKLLEKGLTPYSEESLKKRFSTTLAERHFHTDARGNPYWFNFKIETIGTIPPLVIFYRALHIMKNKIRNFNSMLIKNDSSSIKIEPSKDLLNGYKLIITGEDDTLGTVIHTYLTNMYADYALEPDHRILNYVGYVRPHPLEMKLLITIQPTNPSMMWQDILENMINPACKKIVSDIAAIEVELEASSAYNSELKRINVL